MDALAELRELERVVVDAWPANEVAEHEGWLLRASGGPTHRGNSVATLAADGDASLDARIEGAEAWYRERGRRAMFQVGPCAAPAGLDAALAARGYRREGAALLARAEVATVLERSREARSSGAAAGDTPLPVRVESRPSAAWLALNASSSRFASSMDVFRAFLERLGGRCRFVAVCAPSGEAVASGLGIASGAYLGVYAMFTRPDFRRRGAARRALHALAQSAHEDGATHQLYLLVEGHNTAARHLYAQCGFRDVYAYHYRVTPP
jgi:RimJ/RimL family protein N-acetyltransferase